MPLITIFSAIISYIISFFRFWYENKYNGLGCTEDEVEQIKRTTLRDILRRNKVNDNMRSVGKIPTICHRPLP